MIVSKQIFRLARIASPSLTTHLIDIGKFAIELEMELNREREENARLVKIIKDMQTRD